MRWRFDKKCGTEYSLSDGNTNTTECDPDGKRPCCSAERNGTCGYTADHCTCEGCTDYRDVEKWIEESKCMLVCIIR